MMSLPLPPNWPEDGIYRRRFYLAENRVTVTSKLAIEVGERDIPEDMMPDSVDRSTIHVTTNWLVADAKIMDSSGQLIIHAMRLFPEHEAKNKVAADIMGFALSHKN